METLRFASALVIFCLLLTSAAFAQTDISSFSGKRQKRIVIRNATVVDGSGKQAAGPFDIVIENDRITQIVAIDPVAVKGGNAKRPEKGDLEIDATGKYVLPGLINIHAHTQDERGGKPQPVEYCTKMWLAYGITTVRDVLSTKKTLEWRQQSAANLGQENTLGRVRVGYKADLIVVNGNPLENFKVLYPNGTDEVRDGKVVRGGGIEWTIKDGIPFHVPTVSAEIRAMVAAARKGQNRER